MKKAIFGNGGHADEVISQMNFDHDIKRFIDDEFYDNKLSENILPLSKFDPYEFQLMICVGNSIYRSQVIKKLPKETKFFSFIHRTSLILDKNCIIGEGSFIGAYSIITTNISIGRHAILNRGNHIGHDCSIGDFFSMMPGSIVSGNCTIGNCVYLGSNSTLKEKIKICENVTVGINAAVVKDINISGVYTGVPAKFKK